MKNISQNEVMLYKSKWWDYKILSPESATLSFICAYGQRVPLYMERLASTVNGKNQEGEDIKYEANRYVNVLKHLDVESPEDWKHWKNITKLRQFADLHGMKYKEFWDHAVEAHEALNYKHTWVNVFLAKRLQEEVVKRFHASRLITIPTAEFSYFKADEFTGGCELQNKYYLELTKMVMAKYGSRAKDVLLGMVSDGLIPVGFFTKESK
jgi:hypothetical protein